MTTYHSQNGYTAAPTASGIPSGVTRITPKGAPESQFTVRKDISYAFQTLLDWYQALVEDIDLYTHGTGDDYGYYFRPIRPLAELEGDHAEGEFCGELVDVEGATAAATTNISNHGSATAVDVNATRHPLGTTAAHSFTKKQISTIHTILKTLRGIFRWGGDYSGRKDPMHFEIVGSLAEVKSVIADIKSGKIKRPGSAPSAFTITETDVLGPITPDVLWQCSIKHVPSGEFLVSVVSGNDSLFVHLAADGVTQLNTMRVTGTYGHQTEFGLLDDWTVQYSVNDSQGHDLCELPYRPGTFKARAGRTLHAGTLNSVQITCSPTRKYAIIREFLPGTVDEVYWRVPMVVVRGTKPFNLSDVAVGKPVRVTPNSVPTQGFASCGDDLFILKGATDTAAHPNRRYLEKKSFVTGGHVATFPLDQYGPDDMSVEPEGVDGTMKDGVTVVEFGLKCGNGEDRRLCRNQITNY